MIDRNHDGDHMTQTRCACGRPLHYTSPATRETIEGLIALLGPTVRVSYGKKQYDVSRHYIALHGIRAADLAALARRGCVTEVSA